MLPKAVLSIVGRFVGIAAVLLSPLAAGAAEASDAPPSGSETLGDGASGSVPRRAPHQADASPKAEHASAVPLARAPAQERGAEGEETRIPARGGEGRSDGGESQGHDRTRRRACGDDRARERQGSPEQSATPLATLAAAVTKPLIEPISTKAEVAVEPKAHAVEPRRTPIVRAAAHTRDAEVPRREKKHAKPPCLHAPVSVTRGTEEETFALTKCDGSAAPNAVEEMSILVRPGSAAKPATPTSELSAKTAKGKERRARPGHQEDR